MEKQLLDWHCANLEYGCAAHLDLVALHEWDQDDQFEFYGEHCMLEKGYENYDFVFEILMLFIDTVPWLQAL